MKQLFLALFALFFVLYLGALWTIEDEREPGAVLLVRSTDAAPSRPQETRLFRQRHPEIDIKVDPGMGGDQTKLLVQCATGVGPDIIDVYNMEAMVNLVEAGILLDLTPHADAMGFGMDATFDSLEDRLFYEGKQYRYPCNVNANGIIYNKRIFDELGLPYPKRNWTWREFIEVGRVIASTPSEKTGRPYVPLAVEDPVPFVRELIAIHRANLFSPDGLVCTVDSPEVAAAFVLWRDLTHKHDIIPNPAEVATMASQGGWGIGGVNWFAGERAAMIIIGRWFIIQLPSFPNLRGAIAATDVPRLEHQEYATPIVTTRAAAINAQSEHVEEALAFLRFLASEEYARLIARNGDALPPNPDFARTGQDLVTSAVPDPEFHQVFIDAITHAWTLDVSPFIDPVVVDDRMRAAIDKVGNKVLTIEEALDECQTLINRRIRDNLERRADLRAKFETVRGVPWSEDWR